MSKFELRDTKRERNKIIRAQSESELPMLENEIKIQITLILNEIVWIVNGNGIKMTIVMKWY